MSDPFYRAFEDHFRGSRDTIKERLRAYVAFVDPLARLRPDASALDLGCGRGEWLELMGERGIAARGVDTDGAMLQACREAGLQASLGDATQAMRECPDGSQDIVSGFHIAEHLAFNDLRTVVSEARRVLRPGGLLILETPNPENPSVGGSSFYLDPTHVRPIPAPLLAFLAEYHGFARVKVIRLHDDPGLGQRPPGLWDVLTGSSPDYAVVAQNPGPAPMLEALREPFEKEHGVTLEALATRYDAAQEARLREARAHVDAALRSVDALRASRTWRWTAPIRSLVEALARALRKD